MVLTWLVYCLFNTNSLLAQTNLSKKSITTDKIAQTAGTTKAAGTAKAASRKIFYGTDGLPQPVLDMREHILSAVRSGNIEDLRLAIEWNELRPEFGTAADSDAIAYFRKISADGKGREILAILGNILESGHARTPLGPDIENNLIYVWPYFAEMSLQQLTAGQQVELLRIVPAGDFKTMMAGGKYTGYRLSIGADGTWHEFVNGK